MEDWLQIGGGVAGGGSLFAILFKLWANGMQKKLSDNSEHIHGLTRALHNLQVELAERKGQMDGQSEVVWREINTDKKKIAELQASDKKAWEIISRIVQPRISDILDKESKK